MISCRANSQKYNDSAGLPQTELRHSLYTGSPVRQLVEVLLEYLLLTSISITFIPNSITDTFRLWGLPAVNFIWLAFFVTASAVFFSRKKRSKTLFLIYALGFGYMALVGVTRSDHPFFSFSDFCRDLVFTSGLLGGIAWGGIVDQERARSFELRLAALAVILLTLTQVGLALGVIPAVVSEGRVFEPSQFSSSYFVMALAPMLWLTPPKEPRLHWLSGRRCLAIFGLVAVGLFSLISVTRSSFLLFIFSVLAIILITSPRWRVMMVFLGLGGVLALHYSTTTTDIVSEVTKMGPIGQRFALLVDARSEIRFQEIQELISQTSGSELIFGKGYGIGFISSIAGDDLQSTVLNPHVGVLAFLQKGGILVFLASLAPLAFALRRLFARSVCRQGKALYFGIIFFYACGSISGGWYIMPFFLLGYSLSRIGELDQEWAELGRRKRRPCT